MNVLGKNCSFIFKVKYIDLEFKLIGEVLIFKVII